MAKIENITEYVYDHDGSFGLNKDSMREFYRFIVSTFETPQKGVMALLSLLTTVVKGNTNMTKEQFMELCEDVYNSTSISTPERV